jgi:argininosuccinate lyase
LLAALEHLRIKVVENSIQYRAELEDVHTNLEAELAQLAGSSGGHAGVARGRNDLAVTALRMWVRAQCDHITEQLLVLCETIGRNARRDLCLVMPGMTHLQPAQAISVGHLWLAYGEMFLRDVQRFSEVRRRLNECPLGACALAGTSFDIDRHFTAQQLGFESPCRNSIDAVADRDFVLDFLGACTTYAIHASRVCEDLLIWLTPQFGFFALPDFLVGRSTIMPHKRNPDLIELIRGKVGRVAGSQQAIQMVLKGLSISYCRDLQEDKEATFDAARTVGPTVDVLRLVFEHIEPRPQEMLLAANSPHTTSTDYVDWLVGARSIPYKEAHRLVGCLVDVAIASGTSLPNIPEPARVKVDERLAGDDWPRFDAQSSMRSRDSYGGTAPERVERAADAFDVAVRANRGHVAKPNMEGVPR